MKMYSRMLALVFVSGILIAPVASLGQEYQDEFEVLVDDNTVTVLHNDAEYNCCFYQMLYDITIEGNQLDVVETEDIGGGGCYCTCPFDLSVAVDNLPEGQWTLVFHWLDWNGWQQVELPFTVEQSGQPGSPEVAAVESSGCTNDTTAVPDQQTQQDDDQQNRSHTWSTIKSLYN